MLVNRSQLLDQLKTGDRRSIGRSEAVVRAALRSPGRLLELAAGLGHPNGLVRMRASDALEKVSRERPEWLRPIRAELLTLAGETREQEVRWHLAQLLPRLGLRRTQRQRLVWILRGYLRDPSAIVRVSALQALVELSSRDRTLERLVRRQLRRALTRGTPAERARARQLRAEG